MIAACGSPGVEETAAPAPSIALSVALSPEAPRTDDTLSAAVDGGDDVDCATLPLDASSGALRGGGERYQSGSFLAAAGDLDGDGLADLLAGAPTARGYPRELAWVVTAGQITAGVEWLDDAAWRFSVDAEDPVGAYRAGGATPGDVDAAGRPDLLLGGWQVDYDAGSE